MKSEKQILHNQSHQLVTIKILVLAVFKICAVELFDLVKITSFLKARHRSGKDMDSICSALRDYKHDQGRRRKTKK
jgi:hypothetical protein